MWPSESPANPSPPAEGPAGPGRSPLTQPIRALLQETWQTSAWTQVTSRILQGSRSGCSPEGARWETPTITTCTDGQSSSLTPQLASHGFRDHLTSDLFGSVGLGTAGGWRVSNDHLTSLEGPSEMTTCSTALVANRASDHLGLWLHLRVKHPGVKLTSCSGGGEPAAVKDFLSKRGELGSLHLQQRIVGPLRFSRE